jgi:hypothetical protein
VDRGGEVSRCWKDRAEHVEEQHGLWSPAHIRALYYQSSVTCMLAAEHEGDHEWTQDDQIGVQFSANAPADAVEIGGK